MLVLRTYCIASLQDQDLVIQSFILNLDENAKQFEFRVSYAVLYKFPPEADRKME